MSVCPNSHKSIIIPSLKNLFKGKLLKLQANLVSFEIHFSLCLHISYPLDIYLEIKKTE